jgi:hypothetical protein
MSRTVSDTTLLKQAKEILQHSDGGLDAYNAVWQTFKLRGIQNPVKFRQILHRMSPPKAVTPTWYQTGSMA